nr:hypothetical protein [Tanacetum cinerariifolium]
MRSTYPVPTSQDTPVDVSDLDPLSFANPQSIPTENVAQSSKGEAVARDPESKNTSFTSMVGSPESIYQPEWGMTNGCRLDAPEACQDLVDHIAPPRYFSELRHLHNDDFLKQYNINLARQVAMGSQLWLRFEQEAKLLKKSVAQVARRDQRIQARENEIKNLEALLEAETDMKKTAEAKNAELGKELENLRALFSNLQVSNDRLSQQTLNSIIVNWVPSGSKTMDAGSLTISGLHLTVLPFKKICFFTDKKELQSSATALGYVAHLCSQPPLNICLLVTVHALNSLKDFAVLVGVQVVRLLAQARIVMCL